MINRIRIKRGGQCRNLIGESEVVKSVMSLREALFARFIRSPRLIFHPKCLLADAERGLTMATKRIKILKKS